MDFRDNKAIYLQIVDYVCEKILQNEWLPNKKILSVRELAIALEVNPNTVMRSYEFLTQEDIIHTQRGIGYFVSINGVQRAIAFKKQEFEINEIPLLHKTMQLLNISMSDLEDLLKKQAKK